MWQPHSRVVLGNGLVALVEGSNLARRPRYKITVISTRTWATQPDEIYRCWKEVEGRLDQLIEEQRRLSERADRDPAPGAALYREIYGSD